MKHIGIWSYSNTFTDMEIPIQHLEGFCEEKTNVSVDMLRTDLYYLDIPGNKYFKMKYNIEEMKRLGLNDLVTFGGAFSNHIAAVAEAGKKFGFNATGVIRGEASSWHNATLSKAESLGMNLKFIDRSTYREWKKGVIDIDDFIGLKEYYLLPEGGSNALAVKGCAEITAGLKTTYDLIACPVGSGGTLAGIISSSKSEKVLGFSSLKGGQYMEGEIEDLLKAYYSEFKITDGKKDWELIHDFHFGGFAKMNAELLEFFDQFKEQWNIELDLIYTAKMMYGLREMVKGGKVESGSRILAIHTGGQQGNGSMLERWGKKLKGERGTGIG